MAGNDNVLDLTKDGVVFAPWPTPVENDDLHLRSLSYNEARQLVATFECERLDQDVIFAFKDNRAFRVLDEGGLIELWAASEKTPRPAQTTFLVRGHLWQHESFLAWVHGTDEPYFSYMIATGWDCLEVVSYDPPEITISPAKS